jgi:hypothetical protein
MQQLYWILAVVSDIVDIHYVLGVCCAPIIFIELVAVILIGFVYFHH